MRSLLPARWDDVVLAILLMLTSAPRVILAAYEDKVGAEATLALIGLVLGLLLLVHRNRPVRRSS